MRIGERWEKSGREEGTEFLRPTPSLPFFPAHSSLLSSPLSERMEQANFYTRLQEVTSLKEPFDVLVSLPSITNSKRTIL